MRIGIWMLAAALAVGSATAADLNGRKITVTYGDHTTLYAPVTLPCTDSAEGKIVATDDATARAYPASIRNGELVFVPEGGIAKAVQTYTLSVTPREEGTEPMVRVEKRGEEAAVDVFIEDVLFTTYHYDKKWKKPFLWPLNSEGGVGVTRDFPMVAEGTAKFAQDHPHHKSFWSAYGEVNGVDCWAEGGGSGDQKQERLGPGQEGQPGGEPAEARRGPGPLDPAGGAQERQRRGEEQGERGLRHHLRREIDERGVTQGEEGRSPGQPRAADAPGQEEHDGNEQAAGQGRDKPCGALHGQRRIGGEPAGAMQQFEQPRRRCDQRGIEGWPRGVEPARARIPQKLLGQPRVEGAVGFDDHGAQSQGHA